MKNFICIRDIVVILVFSTRVISTVKTWRKAFQKFVHRSLLIETWKNDYRATLTFDIVSAKMILAFGLVFF